MAELKEAPRPVTNGPKGQATDVARPAAKAPATPAMPAGSPFEFMRRFAEEMDHLFEDFGFGAGWRMPTALMRGREMLRRETGLIPADWSPRVDVQHRDGAFVVRADLPGMTKDDIQIELTDEAVMIRGERKDEKKEKHEGYAYSECSYGSFYRAIPLPEGADSAKATAEFRNGVLEVVIPAPRMAEKKPRHLEVKEGK